MSEYYEDPDTDEKFDRYVDDYEYADEDAQDLSGWYPGQKPKTKKGGPSLFDLAAAGAAMSSSHSSEYNASLSSASSPAEINDVHRKKFFDMCMATKDAKNDVGRTYKESAAWTWSLYIILTIISLGCIALYLLVYDVDVAAPIFILILLQWWAYVVEMNWADKEIYIHLDRAMEYFGHEKHYAKVKTTFSMINVFLYQIVCYLSVNETWCFIVNLFVLCCFIAATIISWRKYRKYCGWIVALNNKNNNSKQ